MPKLRLHIIITAAASVAAAAIIVLNLGSPLTAGLAVCVLLACGALVVLRRSRKRVLTQPSVISEAMAMSDRLAGLGSIAATVAHEIRNPLSALDIHAQLLEEQLHEMNAGKEAAERLAVIRAEVHRLNLIVENFIRFARPKPLDARPIQVSDPVKNVIRLIQSEANERNIEIDTSALRSDLPPILADQDQLEQAVLNIIINALQSMEHGGTLTVASSLVNGYAECTVLNTGPEIPADIRDRIFDLYFTTKPNGSGLGLPIAQKTVSEHKGYIRFETSPDFTSFTLCLPVITGA